MEENREEGDDDDDDDKKLHKPEQSHGVIGPCSTFSNAIFCGEHIKTSQHTTGCFI